MYGFVPIAIAAGVAAVAAASPPKNLADRARWYRAKARDELAAVRRATSFRAFPAAREHQARVRAYLREAIRLEAIVRAAWQATQIRAQRRVQVLTTPRPGSVYAPPGGWPPVPGARYQTVEVSRAAWQATQIRGVGRTLADDERALAEWHAQRTVRGGPRPADLPTAPTTPVTPIGPDATAPPFEASKAAAFDSQTPAFDPGVAPGAAPGAGVVGESPWYKKPVNLAILALLGGGAYMLTRKRQAA